VSDEKVLFALEVRYQVAAFALLMERELRANDHKGGWDTCDTSWLLKRIEEEAKELRAADPDRVRYPYGTDVINDTGKRADLVESEAADVANFAMMVADVAVGLERPAELHVDRIRADAMAERTREIVAKLRAAAGVPDDVTALRYVADRIAAAYPEAFPQPEPAK
jgi:hypothetical protein